LAAVKKWLAPNGFFSFASACPGSFGGDASADHPKIARTAEGYVRPKSPAWFRLPWVRLIEKLPETANSLARNCDPAAHTRQGLTPSTPTRLKDAADAMRPAGNFCYARPRRVAVPSVLAGFQKTAAIAAFLQQTAKTNRFSIIRIRSDDSGRSLATPP